MTRLAAVLADPRVRLGEGMAVILVTAWAAHRDHLDPAEATAFRAVNGLPDSIHLPAWAIMQLGTFGAAPVAAGLAWLAGEHRLAGQLLAAGTGAGMSAGARSLGTVRAIMGRVPDRACAPGRAGAAVSDRGRPPARTVPSARSVTPG